MYPSTKEQPANQEMNGKQSSKVAPMFASAMQPWQDNLGARTLLVLHQDVAVMFVNMVPIKLEQLLKRSAKKGSRRSTTRDLGPESLAWTFTTEGTRNSFTHSDRGIYFGDVIIPTVNHLRVSLSLPEHHQPGTAWGSSKGWQEDGYADHSASWRLS